MKSDNIFKLLQLGLIGPILLQITVKYFNLKITAI